MTTITIDRALLEQAYAMLSSNKTLIRVVMSRDELCVAIRSALAAPAAAPWLHMKSAPKDGTAVLVLLDGSDIPHAARWISGHEDSRAPSDTSSAGWHLTWDGYRLTERDGPRCWMQCPSESEPAATAAAPDELERLRILAELMKEGLDAVEVLIDNSNGVAGLHQSGDIASWSELRTGGRFEAWLLAFDDAREAAMKGTP